MFPNIGKISNVISCVNFATLCDEYKKLIAIQIWLKINFFLFIFQCAKKNKKGIAKKKNIFPTYWKKPSEN